MKKIGILTSGGDCQSLNATMRAVVMGLYKNVKDVEIYGMIDGYKGLIYGNYKKMKKDDFKGILNKGGTILGTSRQPFKLMGEPGEGGIDKVKGMKDTYKKLKLDALVILGGNGTHKTANLLRTQGLNVVTWTRTRRSLRCTVLPYRLLTATWCSRNITTPCGKAACSPGCVPTPCGTTGWKT